MSMLKEFKDFAVRGNLIDMAVAFVMGGAFAKVVSSFIDGVVMPPISLISGGDIEGAIVIKKGIPAVMDAAGTEVTAAVNEVAIKYGDFLSATITFILVAFVMFLVIKAINQLKKKEVAPPAAPAAPSAQEVLLSEIRDLLKK